MPTIETSVRSENGGWTCTTTVRDDTSESTHTVTVRREHLERFGIDEDRIGDLVEASFDFLLDREPKESILNSFELDVIERYFPEYPDRVGDYLDRV